MSAVKHDRQPPTLRDAPGIAVYRCRSGWSVYWSARRDLVTRGYPLKSKRLFIVGDNPSEWERTFISDSCNKLEDQMLAWELNALIDSPPTLENAPGHKIRQISCGWAIRWCAQRDLVKRGCPLKSKRLFVVSDNPSECERKLISDSCNKLQDEMLAWGRGEPVNVSHLDSPPTDWHGIEEINARISKIVAEMQQREIVRDQPQQIAVGQQRKPNVETQPAANSSVEPPFVAEWLLVLITPRRQSEALLGDLAERFRRHAEARGLRRARWLYFAEACRSVLPIILAKAKKVGAVAAIAEIWRRMHS